MTESTWDIIPNGLYYDSFMKQVILLTQLKSGQFKLGYIFFDVSHSTFLNTKYAELTVIGFNGHSSMIATTNGNILYSCNEKPSTEMSFSRINRVGYQVTSMSSGSYGKCHAINTVKLSSGLIEVYMITSLYSGEGFFVSRVNFEVYSFEANQFLAPGAIPLQYRSLFGVLRDVQGAPWYQLGVSMQGSKLKCEASFPNWTANLEYVTLFSSDNVLNCPGFPYTNVNFYKSSFLATASDNG